MKISRKCNKIILNIISKLNFAIKNCYVNPRLFCAHKNHVQIKFIKNVCLTPTPPHSVNTKNIYIFFNNYVYYIYLIGLIFI